MSELKKDSWSGKLGFILAAAGSAIGLGNIWRFPYIVGENGGGAFLFIYLGVALFLGFGLMLAETVIGHVSQKPTVQSFKKLTKKSYFSWIGYPMLLAVTLLIFIYAVVGGWTLGYMTDSTISLFSQTPLPKLGDVLSSPYKMMIMQFGFLGATVFVLLFGIKDGLETCCKYLMPILFAIILILIVRSVTLDGGMAGVSFYLTPDFSKVTIKTLQDALGMALFSLSIGMGSMLTYASYLSKKEGLVSPAAWTVFMDTSVCIAAGFFIMPAVFSAGLSPSSGPGLVFETLPNIFNALPMGTLFSTAFFALLLLAALTSSISILEVIVAHFTSKGWNRKVSLGFVFAIAFIGSIPPMLSFGPWSGAKLFGMGIFDIIDNIISIFLLPLNAIAISLFVGWVIDRKAAKQSIQSLGPTWIDVFFISCKYVIPLLIGYVFMVGLWSFIGKLVAS